MHLAYSGTVRDLYVDSDDLLIVTSDRVGVHGRAMPNTIPDKGPILTALTLWWFDRLGDVCPHHVISATDVPGRWAGRAIRCRPLDMIRIEVIVRGYLAGAGLAEYVATGRVCGARLPRGLAIGSKLPEPVLTLATKGRPGERDTPAGFSTLVSRVGNRVAREIRRVAHEVYRRGADLLATRGLILADTKLELGWDVDAALVLGDEVLTPDSSRLWPADTWRPGVPPPSLDRQYVRDWAASVGWDGRSPAPRMPDRVVTEARRRYVAAYERMTGDRWTGWD